MANPEEPPVIDDAQGHRLVIELDEGTAELVYRVLRGRLLLLHTEVPVGLRGAGIGGRLVRAALARAVEAGLTVVPLCPYAISWLERHPEEAHAATIEWSAGR